MSRVFNYDRVPRNHKFRLSLNKDVATLRCEFQDLIEKLRMMCGSQGLVYKGIPEANFKEGIPLLEVEVVYEKQSCKVLILKHDVYIIGYSWMGKWNIFNDIRFKLAGVLMLKENSSYTSGLPSTLGVAALVDAVRRMNSNDSRERKFGCEILFVHLCESVRFEPIRQKIIEGIKKVSEDGTEEENEVFDGFDSAEEEKEVFEWVDEAANFPDVTRHALQKANLNFHGSVAGFEEMDSMAHQWSGLSKIWAKHCATGSLDPFNTKDVRSILKKCGISSIRSIKYVLALMSSQNLEELKDSYVPTAKSSAVERACFESVCKQVKIWSGERALVLSRFQV
ncbi:unnamed protein product [Cuscuta campestris]|uniref:rRNA N-glycosylase n=1 Tax=Cuscuta campestris TaxID=132261 RepID=A0A484KT26_9ASTE|nr:unnamed protein product [Cuscuta campestris]